MTKKTMEELVEKLISGITLEGEDALSVLNATEMNPWYIWIQIALVSLYYGDIETAKIILDGLLCSEEL